MNDQTLSLTPDDPRLTAFALGELEGAERAQVAAAIAANPALQSAVDDIRATAAQLESVLATEPIPAAPADPALSARKAAIIPGDDLRRHDGGPRRSLGEVIPFRRYFAIAGGLAAAGLAVMVTLRQPPPGTAAYQANRDAEMMRQAKAAAEADLKKPLADEEPLARERARKDAEDKLRQEAQAAADVVAIAASSSQPAPSVPPVAPGTNVAVVEAMPPPAAPAGAEVRPNLFQAGGTATDSYKVESFDFGSATPSNLFSGATAPVATPPPPASVSQVAQEATVQLNPFTVGPGGNNSFQSSNVGTGGRVPLNLPRQAGSGGASADSQRGWAVGVNSQTTPPPASASASASANSDTIRLSPFEVTEAPASRAVGRGSAAAAAGGGAAAGGARGGGGGGRSGAALPAGLAGRGSAVGQAMPAPREAQGTESYGLRRNNTFVSVASQPLSTFSIDVDSAAYSNVRRFLQSGRLPPVDAVRVEELINYFPYRYPAPENPVRPLAAAFGLAPRNEPAPFAASLEVATAPWDSSVRLVRVGLKGREVATADRPRANLVFLLDVSGSMDQPNKLPLVKESMRLLLRRLREDDRVAIVVYAGASGVALPSTMAANSGAIESAIERLAASGSTNGAAGINLAYQIANENFVRGGINRVILCTDGDFNVGVTNQGDLVRMVEERAKSNVFLTVLGFGMGNLKDSTLELLADKGNGNYGYIDTRAEAEKMLVDQVNGTLVTIAKDVKIQVEFNPARVSAYRLVGYENRLLAKEDFNNDRVDAGEIGAGHTVTALYEVVPAAGANIPAQFGLPPVDELKYQRPSANATAGQLDARFGAAAQDSDELLTVKIRYKEPTGTESSKLEFPLRDTGKAFAAASPDFKFAAAVAGFGLALREDRPNVQVMNAALEWANDGLRDDPMGYRAEFTDLVRRATALAARGVGR